MSRVVGIDIGYETLKAISLEKDGKKWQLGGMNVAPIPAGSWQTDSLLNQEAIAHAMKDALRLAKPSPIKDRAATIALPESVIFSGTFSMPTLSSKELKQAVPFELVNKLSLNLEDFNYDYEIIKTKCHPIDQLVPISSAETKDDIKKPETARPKPNEPQLTVFAVAAKKTLIQSVIDLFKKAELELVAIDIKPGAIARAIIKGNDDKARAIIDLGAGSAGASIVEGKGIRVTSTIPWGVKNLFERNYSPEELQKEFSPVFDELVHITKFFENRVCPQVRIEQIILSGSGANLVGVAEVFQRETGLPTVLGEPFARVDSRHYPLGLELGHTFADAVGLAMWESK